MSRTSLKRTRASRRLIASFCISLAAFLCVVVTTADACSGDYRIWMPRHKNADALYRFIRDGKAGYIDRAGKVVVEPKFEPYGNYGGEFHDGLVEVGVSSGEYVDLTGKALDFGLEHGWDFSDGLAAAFDEKAGKWGYIERTGKFAISPRFEGHPRGYVSSFSEGRAWIEVEKKYGFIDGSGEFVAAPTLLWGEAFNDGMALVIVEGPCRYAERGDGCTGSRILGGERGAGEVPSCKVTFVDRHGSVLEGRFDDAKDFSEGLAPFMKGDKWGFIDKSGGVRIEPSFDDAWPFSGGRARVKRDGLYGYIDERGEFAVTPRFEEAGDFSDGRAVVAYKELDDDARHTFYYIDRDGRAAIRGPFYEASHFFKGLAHVEYRSSKRVESGYNRRRRRFAYLDAKGKTVFAYEYEVGD